MRLLVRPPLPDGYRLDFETPEETPELEFNGSMWVSNAQWIAATETLRASVVSVLYDSRDKLFKTSPTQKTLENLMAPWVVIDVSGNYSIKCDVPMPENLKSGKGILSLIGIVIKKTGISPIWIIKSYSENTPVVDFDWNESTSLESEIREITLIEAEVPSENNGDTIHLNTDEEYNARKFAAKERVKEARLKAILARRAAEVETNRYFNDFNINEAESTFSEYDISDFSEDEEEETEETAN